MKQSQILVPRQNSDGKLVDATALDIKPLVKHTDPVASYVSSRGDLKDVWGTEEAQEYIASLRGRSDC